MSETSLANFNKSGSPEDALQLVRAYKTENEVAKAIDNGLILNEVFFNQFDLLVEITDSLQKSGRHLEAHRLLHSRINAWKNLPEGQARELLRRAAVSAETDQVQKAFTEYNEARVKSIMERPKRIYPVFTLTMTTCKRYELFEQTINSFINCCSDVLLIDNWICVDDLSSDSDRKKMREKYPFFEFYMKEYPEKGHPKSMNILKNLINTPYFIHLEDDWRFYCEHNYISECFDVLTSNPKHGQCLINKNYSEIPKNVTIPGGHFNRTIFGTRYYVHETAMSQSEKEEFVKRYGNEPNSSYWPHFSLRPSMFKTEVLKKIGDFNETAGHFEMEYAERYFNNGYLSTFLEGIYCMHIGRLTTERNDDTKLNAYVLNSEAQFGVKKEINMTPRINDATPPPSSISNEQKLLEQQRAEIAQRLKEIEESLNKNKAQQQQTSQNDIPKVSDVSKLAQLNQPQPQQPPQRKALQLGILMINLDRRPDRFQEMQKKMPTDRYNRIPAIDGLKLKTGIDLCRVFENNDYNMRAGMVGCAMTHLKIWTDLLKLPEDKLDGLIVFEDDVDFCENAMEKISEVIARTTPTTDIIFLGHHLRTQYERNEFAYFKGENTTPISLEKWNVARSITQSMGGTFGYIITRSGAKKLIDYINANGMTNGIDTVMQKICNNAEVMYCYPHVVRSKVYENISDDSDIQNNNNSLSLNFMQKLELEKTYYDNVEMKSFEELKFGTKFTCVCQLSYEQLKELQQRNDVVVYNLDDSYYTVTTSDKARPRQRIPLINGHYTVDHMLTF